MTIDLSNPRQTARECIKSSLPLTLWNQNVAFSKELSDRIEAHRILKHPIIELMNGASFDESALRVFHLEFGHAFARLFTDAVLNSMGTCAQLERRLGPKGKMAARFLLQLNMIDELGFQEPDGKSHGYQGHPFNAHYVKFHETLEQLGISFEQMLDYQASPYAIACSHTFESAYGDHAKLTCVLACAESCFDVFAGPWARNTKHKTNVNVDGGYHSIHSLDEDGHGIDDEHSEDMWLVFSQAVTPDRYDELRKYAELCVNTWTLFADSLIK